MKRFLTQFLFQNLFYQTNIKKGDWITDGNCVFRAELTNGHPGNLRNFYRLDGFWNYIKVKDKKVFCLYDKKWYTIDQIYKNLIRHATKKEIKIANAHK